MRWRRRVTVPKRARTPIRQPKKSLLTKRLCRIDTDTAQKISKSRIGVQRAEFRAESDALDRTRVFGYSAIKPAKGLILSSRAV
jgi:hypothetical protein